MTDQETKDQIDVELGNIVEAVHAIGELVEIDPDTDPPVPPVPVEPNLPFVTMRKKAPLMEVESYDKKLKEVLRMHKYGIFKGKKIRARKDQKLYYVGKIKSAQGIAFRLYSGQRVDGVWLTESNTKKKHPVTKKVDKYFYIRKDLVRM